MTIKKKTMLLSLLSAGLLFAACDDTSNGTDDDSNGNDDNGSSEAFEGMINPVTRESGSGTRGAFEDIFGLDEGEIDFATTQQGTNALMENVAGDQYAIGYTSEGSLNDTVKALSVDGVEPTPENLSSGDYEVFRNFMIFSGSSLDGATQDFWDFIFSEEGQAIVTDEGYLAVDQEAPEYDSTTTISGDIAISGSTSVAPVMETLIEAYGSHQPDVTITLQSSGSGVGINDAIDGVSQIGMASRDLTEEEDADLEVAESMAIDGIAVIVNPDNPIDDISFDSVNGVFTGEITDWSEVQ